ncbi:MAG TPA: glucosidase, partial [Chthonomonadaceae bacterium]|nr:glucosidase [Chthonomonadaceae bacterium]
MTEEEVRLQQAREHIEDWKKWGPYLAERAWGTVREDYSPYGSAWDYFPHDHARSRAYRWNEDGLLGISDRQQFLCFALALWNGNDPIIKERLFGLTGPEGNHGEDVKEYYYYLDSTPTHSYMKALYKYPQAAFPYSQLVEENRRRTKADPEYELLDTGVFAEDRYFDVFVEYAKAEAEDILIAITVVNRGPEEAPLHLLPTLWFRNTWSWGKERKRPMLSRCPADPMQGIGAMAQADHPVLGRRWLLCHADESGPELLFTENESNFARLFPPDGRNTTPYVKDSINDYLVQGNADAVNPEHVGTKLTAHYRLRLQPGETRTIRLRLTPMLGLSEPLSAPFDNILEERKKEADEFYATIAPEGLSEDARNIQRQALAGMFWSKQFYYYTVREWLEGDPGQPPPPESRWQGRNHDWKHLDNDSVLSMPDKWEYPWYAAWDLAFHCIAIAIADPDFAKRQLILLLREWFMHPNGQLPAYEWAFGDVNPPVHAWAALRVYQIERRIRGVGDTHFLERVFQKLLINFTWWVNRKDAEGKNVFQGGFLGLDNIGVFDRSKPLPTGGHLDQSDGTSWMAMYCLNMLGIALELARQDNAYEDVATKFLEHFFYIAHAMNDRPKARDDDGVDLWDNEDGFYYDVLHLNDGSHFFLKIRSIVGLIPLFAVETLDAELLEMLPDFRRRLEWFLNHRQDLCGNVAPVTRPGAGNRRLFAIVNEERLRALLTRALDENEFLSPHGLRSLSRYHAAHPYILSYHDEDYSVEYCPAESRSGLFGGNSNWRGPIWFPVNYMLIDALDRHHRFFGDKLRVAYPTTRDAAGTPPRRAMPSRKATLGEIADDLSRRLVSLFL